MNAVTYPQDHFNLHFDEDGKTLVSADHTVSSNAAADCSSAANPQWMQSKASDVPDKLGPTTNSVKFSKVAPALSTISRRSRSNDSDMEDDEGGDGELRYEDDEDEEGGTSSCYERIPAGWLLPRGYSLSLSLSLFLSLLQK